MSNPCLLVGQTSIQETVSWSGDTSVSPMVNTELFTVLSPLLDHLHTLWELSLTAEPLVVQVLEDLLKIVF